MIGRAALLAPLAARLCRVALPRCGTQRASSSTMPPLAAIRRSPGAGFCLEHVLGN